MGSNTTRGAFDTRCFRLVFCLAAFVIASEAVAGALFSRNFAVGKFPNSVAVADLDGDGTPDLVTANRDSDDVSVLWGRGDASFLAAVSFRAGNSPHSVAVGDFDGDSVLDLVTANRDSDGVSVLLGNGDSTFQAAVSFAAGDAPVFVAVADLDGDSVPDLATANIWSNEVSVLLGNGDGSFQTAISFATGRRPSAVALADLDGDSALDLVTANGGSHDVSVLLGNGDGTFQTAVAFAAGGSPEALGVADFDGDSVPDLVTANSSTDDVAVLLGNGDGSFQTAARFAAGDSAVAVAASDVDGDNILDLVTANSNSNDASVLLGNGDGSFQSAASYVAGNAQSVAVADFDGDSVPDLVTANGYRNDVSVLLGNGDGSFQAAVVLVAGHNPQFAAAADLDSDSVSDLAVANGGGEDVSVLLGEGAGAFQTAVSYRVGRSPFSVAAADLDADTVLDLVAADRDSDDVSVLLGNGDGTFRVAVSFATGNRPIAVSVADFDGDSALDLVTANQPDEVNILFGNGDGTFRAAVPYLVGDDVRFVAVADLDGDSVPDLVTANADSDDVSVLLGNGDGSFQPAVAFAGGNGPHAVAVGDLDRDSLPDLVTANVDGDDVSVLLGNGDGTFRAAVSFAAGRYPSAVAVADLDADTFLDVAIASRAGDVSVLLGNGDGTFRSPVSSLAGHGPHSIAVADLNGDNAPDLVTATSVGVTVLFNLCDPGDLDADGASNCFDNCLRTANPGQEDTDGDGRGDACNDAEDSDGDEFSDALDTCPAESNPGQEDADGDGLGDACNDADDADGDEFSNALDTCPIDSNPGQEDADGDGVGDLCNDWDDGDGDDFANAYDNCPIDFNPGQEDKEDTLVIAPHGFFDAVAPGVGIQVGSSSFGGRGGPIAGVGLEFSCGTCSDATFGDAVSVIGQERDFCGYDSEIPRQIVQNDDRLCARVLSTGRTFEFDLVSFQGRRECVDADGGASCAAVGGVTSYRRPGDGVGDVCDNCPSDRNLDQADFNADGLGDVCDDSDGDDFVDAIDNCPTDFNPAQEDTDGTLVIAPRGYIDLITPEAGILIGSAGPEGRGGPLAGAGLVFSCGTCSEATFEDAVSVIGQGQEICGYDSEIPRQIVQNDDRLCALVFTTGMKFEFDLLSFRGLDSEECVDADGGASCAASGSSTSYRRESGDGVGNVCDNCADDSNPDQADFDADGLGDRCDDSDGDDFLDAADTCPIDFNPGQEDTDGAPVIAPRGSVHVIEPGVGGIVFGTPGSDERGGPITGIGLEFSCGTCAEATFADAVSVIGGGNEICGYHSEIPRQIVQNDDRLCARVFLTGNAFEFDLLSFRGSDLEECVDADGGASCAAAGGVSSYWGRGDGVGDVCDNCADDSNPDQADFDADGFGDVCDDSDGDDFVDAADNCPIDFNPGQEDSEDTLVIAPRGFFYEIGPGVGIQFGSSNPDGGGGPLTGVGIQFSCGTCSEATFEDAVSVIGGGNEICGYDYEIPRQIVQNGNRLCARVLSSGNTFEFDLLSFQGRGGCVDADGGASCAAASRVTSFLRPGDGVGDVCDNCADDSNPDQSDFDADGLGDVCDDSDGDDFADAADNCPTDFNPGQGDTEDTWVIATRDYFDAVESGAGIQVGRGGGPLTGVGIQFSCGTCAEATFADAVGVIGRENEICGYGYEIPRQIVRNDDRLCARVLSTGRAFEFDLLSFQGHEECVDADDGASCTAAGGLTSYRRTGDGVGDICDNCPNHNNLDQADVDADEIGDTCDPANCGDGALGFSEQCDDGNRDDGDGCSSRCVIENHAPVCVEASAQPALLWSVDHKLHSISIEGVTDSDGDPIEVTIDAIHRDETAQGGGLAASAIGIGTSTAQVRAERRGDGDGRVYHIHFEAEDGRGGRCSDTVQVCVPHDRRRDSGVCVDQGPLFDATRGE